MIHTVDASDQRTSFEHVGAGIADREACEVVAWNKADTADLNIRTRDRLSATSERFRIYRRGCGSEFFSNFGFWSVRRNVCRRCVSGRFFRRFFSWCDGRFFRQFCGWFSRWLCRGFFSRRCRGFQRGCFHDCCLGILRSLGRWDRSLCRGHGRFSRWNRSFGWRNWSLCRWNWRCRWRDVSWRNVGWWHCSRRFRGGRAALIWSRFAWAGINVICESITVTIRYRCWRFRGRRFLSRWFLGRFGYDLFDSRPKQVHAVAGQDDSADDQHDECDRGDNHHLPV